MAKVSNRQTTVDNDCYLSTVS